MDAPAKLEEKELGAVSQELRQVNEYVRDDGIWINKKLGYRPVWHSLFENGWEFTLQEIDSLLIQTYPDNPIDPDKLTEYRPALWDEHDLLPFHCSHPVLGIPIKTPEAGLAPNKDRDNEYKIQRSPVH